MEFKLFRVPSVFHPWLNFLLRKRIVTHLSRGLKSTLRNENVDCN